MNLTEMPSIIVMMGQLYGSLTKAQRFERRIERIKKQLEEGNVVKLQRQIDKMQEDITELIASLQTVSPFIDIAKEVTAGNQD